MLFKYSYDGDAITSVHVDRTSAFKVQTDPLPLCRHFICVILLRIVLEVQPRQFGAKLVSEEESSSIMIRKVGTYLRSDSLGVL